MPLPAETDHTAFTRAFRGALTTGALPPGVTARTRDGRTADLAVITARFAIYRNNVMHSLSQALAQRFPVVQRLVGAEFFAAMAAEFIRAHPPASPVLLLWGGDFAGFLSRFPPVQALPYLPDVARIEHSRGQSYHAADIRPLDGAALGAAMGGDAGRLRFALSPSIRVVTCQHGAAGIWLANQPGGGPAARAAGREDALIWRRRDFQVPLRRISPDEAAFLRALNAGAQLAQAAGPLEDPAPLLSLLLAEGLIASASAQACAS